MANSVTIKGESGGAIGVGTTSPTSGSLTVDKSSFSTPAVDLKTSGTSFGQLTLTDSNNLSIGCTTADHTGITFGSTYLPRYNGSNNNGDVDIGAPSFRYKDLYLAGGVVFDAVTGSATSNTLDDYEEGTFSMAENNSSGIGVTLSEAQYTKIGRTVHIYVDLAFTGSNSNPVSFSSLPFTADNDKDQQLNVQTNVSASVPQVFVKGANLNTVKNNATANLLYSDVQNKFLRISGTYQID